MSRSKTDADRQAVIERLKLYKNQFDELVALLSNLPLRGERKTEAKERLTKLKADLREEVRDLGRRKDELDHFQRAFLEPALRKASANILTRVNTIPNDKWHSDLYGARMDITFMLHQLENPSKGQ